MTLLLLLLLVVLVVVAGLALRHRISAAPRCYGVANPGSVVTPSESSPAHPCLARSAPRAPG